METTDPRPPRVRVAAIVVQDDHLLLVRHEKAGRSYWMLPGGGVDYGETLAEALVREVREEACVAIAPERLVWVNDSIPPDRHRHIVNLYFIASVVSGIPQVGADARVVEAAWVSVADLPAITMFPDFGAELAEAIRAGFPGQARYFGNLWRQ